MNRRLTPILAFAVPLAAYAPTLLGTFYYDDHTVFFGHQAKALADAPFSVFSPETHYLPGAPRSIHVFFLLLIYKTFGAAPLPYHAFNLLLHGSTTLMVYLLLKKLLAVPRETNPTTKEAAPLLGSLLFGLHPIHVENITFVTLGGTDIFYAFWALLSLLLYIRFREETTGRLKNYALLALSALFYYFALLSKESAVSFVLIYPLTEFALQRRGFLWALPHAAALLFMKSGLVLGAAPSVIRQAAASPVWVGADDLIKNLGFFLKSLVVPYPHMPFIKEFSNAPVLYVFAVAAALWLLAGIISRKRIVAYSALWFGAVSAPYLFAPASAANISVTAERYIYAPSVAMAIIGAWALARAARGGEKFRSTATAAVSALLVLYAALGALYFFDAWRTEEAFWRYAAKTNPDYVSPYLNLASMELGRGDVAKAKALLAEGLGKQKGMREEFSQTAYALAGIYRREGDLRAAEDYYIRSLKYAEFEFAYIDLGFLYLDTGRPEKALETFEDAARLRRGPRALAGLALAHLRLGEKDEARSYALQTLETTRDAGVRALAEYIIRETGTGR